MLARPVQLRTGRSEPALKLVRWWYPVVLRQLPALLRQACLRELPAQCSARSWQPAQQELRPLAQLARQPEVRAWEPAQLVQVPALLQVQRELPALAVFVVLAQELAARLAVCLALLAVPALALGRPAQELAWVPA